MRIMQSIEVMDKWLVYRNGMLMYNVVEADDDHGYVDCLILPKEGGGFRRQRFHGRIRIEKLNPA